MTVTERPYLSVREIGSTLTAVAQAMESLRNLRHRLRLSGWSNQGGPRTEIDQWLSVAIENLNAAAVRLARMPSEEGS
jgi:hypothetical protein